MEYRSNSHENLWHSFSSCSKWPIAFYDILWLDQPPRLLKVCEECQTLTSTGALTEIDKFRNRDFARAAAIIATIAAMSFIC